MRRVATGSVPRRAALVVAALSVVTVWMAPSAVARSAATAASCRTSRVVDRRYACDRLHITWTGNLQSGHEGGGIEFSSSMSWNVSFSGTLDDLVSGKVVPHFDSFNASETWSYDIGGGCTTNAHLNPTVHTQGILSAFQPGSRLTSGQQVPAWYQDSPKRTKYLVFGDFAFEKYPGPTTGVQAIPDSPDVKYGCDGFAVDGPSNPDDLRKTWTPYALFSRDGTPDASTPAAISVSWNDGESHGQVNGQLTFTANAATAKPQAPAGSRH
jgi:hypothetical protein